ncbi:L-histidine N(alpha)-methyltransferase, partial [Patescibacteria group bacterium]|nr:L-histidine N(alpha)-methyltransferase [Patescibacteria group bacterium]
MKGLGEKGEGTTINSGTNNQLQDTNGDNLRNGTPVTPFLEDLNSGEKRLVTTTVHATKTNIQRLLGDFDEIAQGWRTRIAEIKQESDKTDCLFSAAQNQSSSEITNAINSLLQTISTIFESNIQDDSAIEQISFLFKKILDFSQLSKQEKSVDTVQIISKIIDILLASYDGKQTVHNLQSYVREVFMESINLETAHPAGANEDKEMQNKLLSKSAFLAKIDIYTERLVQWIPSKQWRLDKIEQLEKEQKIMKQMLFSLFMLDPRFMENETFLLETMNTLFDNIIQSQDAEDFIARSQEIIKKKDEREHINLSKIVSTKDLIKEIRNRNIVCPKIVASLKSGFLDPTLAYYQGDLWSSVCESPNYTSLRDGLKILDSSMDGILEIITTKKNSHIDLVDLGIGNGQKAYAVIKKMIEAGHQVSFRGVDSSDEVLIDGMSKIAQKIIENDILPYTNSPELKEDNPWYDLIKLIEKYNLSFSTNTRYWVKKVDEILLNSISKTWTEDWLRHWLSSWLENERITLAEPHAVVVSRIMLQEKEKFVTAMDTHKKQIEIPVKYPPELFKHVITRMLGLHKSDPKGREFIFELDNNTKLPFQYKLSATTFDELEPGVLKQTDSLFLYLGSTICNTFPDSKEIANLKRILKTPQTPKHLMNKSIDSLEEEKELRSPYGLISFQISNYSINDPRFEAEKAD